MAIPAAFTKTRDKLQRTRQQGDRATQGVQRERDTPLSEIVELRGKGHVRQQVAQSPQRVLKSEERKDEPQEFRQEPHVGSFSHTPRAARRFPQRFLEQSETIEEKSKPPHVKPTCGAPKSVSGFIVRATRPKGRDFGEIQLATRRPRAK